MSDILTVFATLADLHRENCNLHLTCKGCGRINTLMPWVLDGRQGVAGQYNESMETKAIADIVARMKCSSCGGREIDWRAMRRLY